MNIIPTTIILLATLVHIARYFRPFANTLEGEPFLVRPVPLIARLRMHIVPAVVGTAVALLLARFAQAPDWTVAVPFAAYALLVAMPISYTLTSEGVRLGRGSFRRWTEFAGAIRYRGGAKLQGANGRRGMRIWLGGGRGDDEFLLVMRLAIRDAYKGGDAARVIPFAPEKRPADDTSGYQIPA
ncbi:MAG TPA: hypothetical protein VNP95_02040 [Thermomicrobiales bacterium]|nr:hypothetical protein [Thermomicrobiales bacterium]